jgi:hypothetical protein
MDTDPTRIQKATAADSFAQISIYNDGFSALISQSIKVPTYSVTFGKPIDFKKEIAAYNTLLISLFVPKAKPLHNFDLEPEILSYLGELIKEKDCILYIFGNPYSLQVIPNLAFAKEIVLAYQDFDVFQEIAAKQLIQQLDCKGELPVQLKF